MTWDTIRGRLAFWGLFLTIMTTLWVMAWSQYLDSQIRYGSHPADTALVLN